MNSHEIREVFGEFSAGAYGRTVFITAYTIPLGSIFAGIDMLIFGLIFGNGTLLTVAAICAGIFIPTFLLGNAYYYREIREFMKHRS